MAPSSSSRRAFVGRTALLGAALAGLVTACTKSNSVAESQRGAASRLVAIEEHYATKELVTTSGYFFDGPMQLTREVFGDDRVIFSVDYPFSENKRAADWLRGLDLAPDVREKIAHGNAERLLKLT